MANNLLKPRTAFHKRLHSLTEGIESGNDQLTAGFDRLGTHLVELTNAVQSRPPPGDQLDYVLNVKIEVVIGPIKWNCWSVGPAQSVLDAAHLMSQKGVTAVFVSESQGIAGLVTRGRALAALESRKSNELAREFMVKHADFIGLRLSDTVRTALDRFEAHRVKRLVVWDAKDRCVALLTSGHLLRWIGAKMKELHSVLSP